VDYNIGVEIKTKDNKAYLLVDNKVNFSQASMNSTKLVQLLKRNLQLK